MQYNAVLALKAAEKAFMYSNPALTLGAVASEQPSVLLIICLHIGSVSCLTS